MTQVNFRLNRGQDMDISIYRMQGLLDNAYARAAPLAVFFNGKPVGRVETGETLLLSLADTAGTLQVFLLESGNVPYIGQYAYDNMTPSNSLEISPQHEVQAFSVRTRTWVFFDVLDLGFLKALNNRILLLEPCVYKNGSPCR